MTIDEAVWTAAPNDAALIAATLADAFHDGDLAPWLVPDPHERAVIYPDYFALLIEGFLAMAGTRIEVYGDFHGVAVWSAVDLRFTLPIHDYDQRLAACCGPHLPRFAALDMVMDAHHPIGLPHDYLAYLAVAPRWQGRGIGTRLLRHRLTRLDAARRTAYLEATGPRNAALYRRHGFQPLVPIQVSGGVQLYPMHRTPHADPHDLHHTPTPQAPTRL